MLKFAQTLCWFRAGPLLHMWASREPSVHAVHSRGAFTRCRHDHSACPIYSLHPLSGKNVLRCSTQGTSRVSVAGLKMSGASPGGWWIAWYLVSFRSSTIANNWWSPNWCYIFPLPLCMPHLCSDHSTAIGFLCIHFIYFYFCDLQFYLFLQVTEASIMKGSDRRRLHRR